MSQSNDDSKQVRILLAQATELPAEQRQTFLEQACRDDAAVRAEVQALLEMLEQADDFLRPAHADRPENASDATWTPAGYAPGTLIKHYTLLNVIGEGGFGRVYLAEQQHPVRRQVALKIIKPGMDTRHVVARFKAERQTLAMMDHPNIARVLDAGSTDDGRPFFVMELVRGIPITEYCTSTRLGLRERLELFAQVCYAVQHAHQKGIIHRDLKPSNVLVTMSDGRPIPKVIDFGVAKAISPTGEMTTLTGERQWMGTPQYMSPEQAGGGTGDIDTRADVYSLGVLLYELLTGATPFDSRELMEAPPSEVQRIISHVEPRRPSARLSRHDTGGATPAADARKLSQQLRGDLDWVVMKCLEKDRGRRYESAGALAHDVEAYLRGEPVQAGPPSQAYRLRKMVRRHRAPLTAAALVVAALVLGTIGTTIEMFRARRATAAVVLQRDAASRNEALAKQEAARAAALSSFLQRMLSSADPQHAHGKELLVREVLDAAARQVDQSPPADPQTAEAIHHTLGTTYQSIGIYGRAIAHFRAALNLRERMYGPDNIETARCAGELADAYWSDRQMDPAVPLYKRSLEIRERLLGHDNAEVAAIMQRVGNMYQGLNDYDKAEELYKESLAIRRRVLGDQSLEAASCLYSLARLQRDRGLRAPAEALITEALAIQRKRLRDDDRTVAESMFILASVTAPDAAAQYMFEQTLAIRRRILGPDHPDVAITLMYLALKRMDQGDFGQETESLVNEALLINHKAFGAAHGDVAKDLQTLAQIHAARHDYAKSQDLFEQALAMYRKTIGEEAPEVRWVLRDLIPVMIERHEFQKAEALLLPRYDWSVRRSDEGSRQQAASLLAAVYRAWPRPQEIDRWASRATTNPDPAGKASD